MDFDGSLTPPRSPGLSDTEPIMPDSPVLVGRKFHNGRNKVTAELTEKCTGYPLSIQCRKAIFRDAYTMDTSYKNTFVNAAFCYWDSLPLSDVTDDCHECDECRRSVMGKKRCLKELEDVTECTNLFYEALMCFQDLEECAKVWIRCTASQNSSHIVAAKKYRKFINEALYFVCEFVQSWNEQNQSNSDCVINIVNLMVMMSNHSRVVFGDDLKALAREDIEISESGSLRGSPLYEWFHSYIDIHCAILRLLPVIARYSAPSKHLDTIQLLNDNGSEISDGEFHWKITRIIISQIMKLSVEKYNKLQRTCKNGKGQFVQGALFQSSPFSCTCVQQLLSLCLHIAGKMKEIHFQMQEDLNSMDTEMNTLGTYNGNSPLESVAPAFWKIIMTFVNTLIQDSQKKCKEDTVIVKGPVFQRFDSVQDALSFCWWWTWHIAHVFCFNESGNYRANPSFSSSCVSLLSRMLRLSLTCCETDDKLLTSHLMCYQAISAFCRRSSIAQNIVTSPELAHFHLLWAHFSKKLNATNKSEKMGIQKYTLKEDKNLSPGNWISKCEKYMNYDRMTLGDESQNVLEDAFKVFLSIFGEIINLGAWSNIKDRFYSRLQPKEIKDLSDTGLSRVFKLFLIISMSNIENHERNAVFEKLTELVNSTTLQRTNYRKQKVLINGLFACVHVSIRYSLKMKAIVTKCGKTISIILKLFSESERSLDQRASLWKIINFYFQNLAEVFQISSSFDLHQELLIPSAGVQSSLMKTKSNEILSILESLTTMLCSLKSHIQHSERSDSVRNCVIVFTSLCNFFLSWLKEISKSEVHHAEEMVTTVIELCDLTLEMCERSQEVLPIKLSALIFYFSCNVEVKLRARFLFLVGILTQDNGKLLDMLNNKDAESEASRLAIIQGSLKCIVSHPHKDDQLHLVRCLSQLDIIKGIMEFGDQQHELDFEQVLIALERRYDTSKTFVERKVQKDQVSLWFNPLSEVIHTVSKTHQEMEAEVITNVYKMCGVITKHCSRILYSAGKSGIIVQMFDTLILPRWIYQSRDKSIHPPTLRALSQTLQMFFRGLLSLDYKRDTYLQRVFSNMISTYITRFPTASNTTSNPFWRLLSDQSLNTDHTIAILKLMKDNCKVGPNRETKLAMIVEILCSWYEHSDRNLVDGEKSSISTILEQASIDLRSQPALMHKINTLRSACNI